MSLLDSEIDLWKQCEVVTKRGGGCLNDQVIRSYESFVKLESRWAAIEKGGGVKTPFQSFAWVDQWLRHRASGVEPFILVVDDGAIIAPFGLWETYGVKTIRLLGSEDSDYLGLVTSLPVEKAWHRVAAKLFADTKAWDLLHLHSVLEREAILSALMNQKGFGFYDRPYEQCPLIGITQSWEHFLSGRKKIRLGMGRWARRLEEIGSIDVEVVSPPISDTLLIELIEVEQASWKWQSGNAAFKDPSLADFLRGVLQDPRTEGKLFLCRLSNKLAGFNLVFTAGERWYYYWSVFGKEYPHVGSYLLGRVVEAAHSASCEHVDLLRGNEDYKSAWADGSKAVYEIVCYSSSRGRVAAMTYSLRWKMAQSRLLHDLRNRVMQIGDRR